MELSHSHRDAVSSWGKVGSGFLGSRMKQHLLYSVIYLCLLTRGQLLRGIFRPYLKETDKQRVQEAG